MELTEAVADLYGLAPEGFLARRKELVAQARAAKDREAVKAIGALRRPAVAAWLVNLLTRDDEGGRQLTELASLGTRLRDAQFSLEANRLRELGRERRARVADLVSRAVDLAEAAGHTVSPAVEREIDETLVAAAADQAATEAVLSGSLTRPLSYSGFGEVDLELAVAMLPSAGPAAPVDAESTPAPAPAAAPDADPEPADAGPNLQELRLAAERAAHVHEATAALQAAESALATAGAAVSQAADRHDQARASVTAATRAVADLERELASAREAAAEAGAEQQAAEEDALTSERAAQAATEDVEGLRRALSDLG